MGNSQATAFRSQFSSMELKETSRKHLWHVYYCTARSKGLPLQQLHAANEAASPGRDRPEVDGSPPSSPRVHDDVSSNSNPPVVLAASTGTIEPLIMLQLNTSHVSFKASLAPPKVLNPDHHSPSAYKLQYNMLETAHRAMQWLRDHPHRSLLGVQYVDFVRDENLLYATCAYLTMDSAMVHLPSMSASEILYGLTKVAEALAHLHSHGLVHRNVSWKSVYLVNSNLKAKSACPWTATDLTWILGDIQFVTRGDGVIAKDAEALKDYLAEIRGVRQDPAVLPYVAPEISNPYAAAQHDWTQIPCGAADVFSFGVMLEQVLNGDRTGRSGGSSQNSIFYNPLAQLQRNGVRVAANALLHFAKLCQNENPQLRPPIEAFFDVCAVESSTYVGIMQELDHYRGSGSQQRLRFFFSLYGELLKVPYDLMVSRIVPRLLKTALWEEPLAEVFLRQLVQPLPLKYLSGSTASAASDVALEDILPLPLSDEAKRSLGLPCGGEAPERNDGGETTGGSGDVSVPLPWTDRQGLLHMDEYTALVGSFLKYLIHKSLGAPHAASPQMLCVLLRNVDTFAPVLSFSQFVLTSLLPFVSMCLKHPADDVVNEAIKAAAYLQRFMLSALQKLRQKNEAASNGQSTTEAVGVIGLHDEAKTRINLEASVLKGVGTLTEMLHTDLLSLAAADARPAVRLNALSYLTKQLFLLPFRNKSGGADKKDREIRSLCRAACLSGLCTNISLVSVTSCETNTLTSFGGSFALDQLALSSRALIFVQKTLSHFTPAETTRDVVPAVSQLIEGARLLTARLETLVMAEPSNATTADKIIVALEGLHHTAIDLLSNCFTRLASLDADAVAAHEEDDDNTSLHSSDGDETSTYEPADSVVTDRHGRKVSERVAVMDGEDGWCTVRDPAPFLSRCVEWGRKHVRPRAAEEPPAGGARRRWTPVQLPPSFIAQLPVYSFVDVDHEYNTHALLKPDKVAADIIMAASSVRTFHVNIKPHVLAARLPSRRPLSSAPAAEGDDGTTRCAGAASGGVSKKVQAATPLAPRKGLRRRPIANVDVMEQAVGEANSEIPSDTTAVTPSDTTDMRTAQEGGLAETPVNSAESRCDGVHEAAAPHIASLPSTSDEGTQQSVSSLELASKQRSAAHAASLKAAAPRRRGKSINNSFGAAAGGTSDGSSSSHFVPIGEDDL